MKIVAQKLSAGNQLGKKGDKITQSSNNLLRNYMEKIAYKLTAGNLSDKSIPVDKSSNPRLKC